MAASEISLPSLSESYRTVPVPQFGHWARRLFAFCGPGYLVAVGYIDPGNWATDIAGGSRYGYRLLWTILTANGMALLLQVLAARLGIATGMDLAQACRAHYARPYALAQWVLCELAICAADLAEVLGSAIALELLFGLPLLIGIGLTSFDVLLIMMIQRRGFRYLEALVVGLLAATFACFVINLHFAHPDWFAVARGFIPGAEVFRDRQMLYIALGIIGATVMPHNLYLHSSIVQTRRFTRDVDGKRSAARFSAIDIGLALTFALVVNASILVTAGAVFHAGGRHDVVEIESAYHALAPLLGTSLASLLFGIALLASGQSSAVTATLAGQIVMEGYTRFRPAPWLRRMVTRGLAILPALVVILVAGEAAANRLLILSQVLLGVQLPFAIWPLLVFTSDRRKMGELVSPRWLTAVAGIIMFLVVTLNVKFVVDVLQ